MKKNFLKVALMAAALCAGMICQAKIINEKEARENADSALSAKGVSFEERQTLRLLRTYQKGNSAPAWYAYTTDHAFAIVAGDDCAPLLLAWSTTAPLNANVLDNTLPHWFTTMGERIYKAREMGVKLHIAKPKILRKINLKTAEWDQDYPFNLYSPVMKNGERAVSGCVPTAMAIAVRYVGTGNVGWDTLPLKYDNSWTEEQKQQVGLLVAECAEGIHPEYTENSTGARMQDVPDSMVEHFGYDQSIQYIRGDYMSGQEWLDCLVDQLRQGRPIIYSVDLSSSKHCVVIDGVDRTGHWHINWGYSGLMNGYFDFLDFDAELGIAPFAIDHAAIINLGQDKGGRAQDNIFICESENGKGIWAADGITLNVRSKVQSARLINFATHPTKGYLAVGRFAADGTLEEIVSDASYKTELNGTKMSENDDTIFGARYSLGCTVKSPVRYGEYLQFVFRTYTDEPWRPVPVQSGLDDRIVLK